MGFKFDDEDDELSLKLGDESVKQQVPAPLPKKAIKPNSEVLNKLPRPGQTAAVSETQPAETESPKPATIPTSAVKASKGLPVAPKAMPASPEKPSLPKKKVEVPSEEVVIEVPEIIEEAEEVTYTPEPKIATPIESTLLNVETLDTSRYAPATPEEIFQSNVVMTPEETESTFKKKSPFEGDRKKILQIRIIAGSVAGLIMIAGVWSFIPKAGFKDDVNSINAAISYTNKYDSIRMASEAYALRFATDFLNRTETTEQYRVETMSTYMDSATLGKVDFALASLPSNSNRNGAKIYQRISSGPYVYNVNNIDAASIQAQRIDGTNGFITSVLVSAYVTPYVDPNEAATVAGGIPDLQPKWVYLSIPVMHNYETKQTSVYGYPSFVAPEITTGLDKLTKPYDEAEWGAGDPVLSKDSVLNSQFENFLEEWSKQSPNQAVSSDLKALLSSDANSRAKKGLAGSYVKADGQEIVYNVNVKPLGKDVKATESTLREALVTVKWSDNIDFISAGATPSTYVQQYIIYFKGTTNKWEIQDIKPRFAE